MPQGQDPQEDLTYRHGYVAGQVEAYSHALFVLDGVAPEDTRPARAERLVDELRTALKSCIYRKRVFDKKTKLR